MPVVVEPPPLDTLASDAPAAGRMGVRLADGSRVIADREVRGSVLARVFAVLARRCDPGSGRCSGLAGEWRDRHAARHEHPGAPAKMPRWPSQGRSDKWRLSSKRCRPMVAGRWSWKWCNLLLPSAGIATGIH